MATIEQLIAKKKEIESEIRLNSDILLKNGVGMSEDLVDPEGFPRADLDIGAIRHARVRIIYLQNDLKNVMEQIKDKLHEIHKSYIINKDTVQENSKLNAPAAPKQEAFLVVDRVEVRSPAESAGLKVNDLITQFGSITRRNFSGLQDIASLVQNSEQKEIIVCIDRMNVPLKLTVIPAVWSGKGLLGCNVLPVKQ